MLLTKWSMNRTQHNQKWHAKGVASHTNRHLRYRCCLHTCLRKSFLCSDTLLFRFNRLLSSLLIELASWHSANAVRIKWTLKRLRNRHTDDSYRARSFGFIKIAGGSIIPFWYSTVGNNTFIDKIVFSLSFVSPAVWKKNLNTSNHAFARVKSIHSSWTRWFERASSSSYSPTTIFTQQNRSNINFSIYLCFFVFFQVSSDEWKKNFNIFHSLLCDLLLHKTMHIILKIKTLLNIHFTEKRKKKRMLIFEFVLCMLRRYAIIFASDENLLSGPHKSFFTTDCTQAFRERL